MPADVAAWLKANGVRVLNVAGNAEHTSPGIGAFVAAFLADVFELWLSQSSDEIGVHAPSPSRVRSGVKSCGRT